MSQINVFSSDILFISKKVLILFNSKEWNKSKNDIGSIVRARISREICTDISFKKAIIKQETDEIEHCSESNPREFI